MSSRPSTARGSPTCSPRSAPTARLVLRSVYALDGESRYLVLECELEGDRFPPLSDLDPAAFVEECEIYEQYGVRPDNDKRLNRVLVPPHRADRFPRLGRREGRRLASDYEPHVVSGEAFEFPFGPVRVVGWESLYMGLVTTGEEVLDLYLFHWHKHRGIERRLTGLDPDRATFFVERADGLSSVGDTLAFCRAVEMATGTEVPPAAAHSRAVALELERIYNHAAAIAALCQTHRAVGRSGALRDRARATAAPEPGRVRPPLPVRRRPPGGVRREPDADQIRAAAARGPGRVSLRRELAAGDQLARRPAGGHGRRHRRGRPAALAGRVRSRARRDRPIDVRRDHPTGVGDEPAPDVRTADGGRRARPHAGDGGRGRGVRSADRRPPRRSRSRPRTDRRPATGAGLGWAESPRGEALAWVSLDGDGRIDQARLRPASVRNWRAFDDAARAQNVFTDIPIIEASFWLTVAGFAR